MTRIWGPFHDHLRGRSVAWTAALCRETASGMATARVFRRGKEPEIHVLGVLGARDALAAFGMFVEEMEERSERQREFGRKAAQLKREGKWRKR